MQILVVEDEPRMARLLKQGLTEAGHTVVLAEDGPSALAIAPSSDFDLVLLDVMLPGQDGFEVARRLRANGVETPILMLTARDAVSDVVRGLDVGADDYLTKPFAFEELLARIRAVARRPATVRTNRLAIEDLVMDLASRSVTRAGRSLTLTKTEFSLLEYLLRRSGRVVSRQALLEGVWGHGRDIEDNTLEAFISLLRQKVDGRHGQRLIRTVRGIGYTMGPANVAEDCG